MQRSLKALPASLPAHIKSSQVYSSAVTAEAGKRIQPINIVLLTVMICRRWKTHIKNFALHDAMVQRKTKALNL